MQLYANNFMRDFVKKLETEPVNWKEVKKLYLSLRRQRSGFQFQRVYGKILEIHVYIVLQEMIRYSRNVYLQPITLGQRTENYEFYRGDADLEFNIRARRLSDHTDAAEYDILMLFDAKNKFPLLIDAKMHKTLEMPEESAARLHSSIALDGLVDFFAPIQERFDPKSLGYIVVVPKDLPLTITEEQHQFVERGGLFAPISMSYDEFITAVKDQPLF